MATRDEMVKKALEQNPGYQIVESIKFTNDDEYKKVIEDIALKYEVEVVVSFIRYDGFDGVEAIVLRRVN